MRRTTPCLSPQENNNNTSAVKQSQGNHNLMEMNEAAHKGRMDWSKVVKENIY